MTLRPRALKEEQTSTPDVISEHLRRAILSGELDSGTQLRQGELAERFGTSRIPIREALRQLEAEGLVTLYPNRGAVVTTLSLTQVLDLLEIRTALECRALKLAVPNMIEEDFHDAESILTTYEKENKPSGWSDMNWRFHKALYTPCHKERLLSLIESNYGQVNRFIRTQVSRAVGKEKPQQDHWALLQLCKEGEPVKAADLLEQHIGRTQKSLMAAVHRGR